MSLHAFPRLYHGNLRALAFALTVIRPRSRLDIGKKLPARIPLRFCASNRARTRGGQCARAASRKINGDASTPTYNRIASLYGHEKKIVGKGRGLYRNWGNRITRDEIEGSGCYAQLSSRADRFRRPSGIERLIAKTTLLLDSNLPSTIIDQIIPT